MFHCESSVISFFSPSKWEDCLQTESRSLLLPDITLRHLDTIYREGTAKLIVKENLRGIFHIAAPREPINEDALDMSAGLIVAKFGGRVSAFAALYFFADYLTEYRSSYGRFDLQDVMRQMGKEFIPWWNERRDRGERKRPEQDEKVTGVMARDNYLIREYVMKGRSVRESNIHLTEEEITRLDNYGKTTEEVF